MRSIILYISGFLVLLLLQEFVISSINLSQFVAIYAYIMVLILFPLQMKHTMVLISAALLGGMVDICSGSSAIAAISMVLVAYLRPFIVKLIIPSDMISAGGVPLAARIGSHVFFRYCLLMSFVYVSSYSFLEVMSLEGFSFTLLRVVLSTLATTIFIYFLQMLFKGK